MTRYLTILVLSVCACHVRAENTRMKELFQWKLMDYKFDTPEQRTAAIDSKEFIEANNLPLGLDVWKDKLFITVPRWKAGVVSSLNYVNISDPAASPKLIPYPDYETNKLVENATTPHITSVFRVRVDECDRLWVMDTGLADILGTPKPYTKPQILIYNLKDNTLIRNYTMKDTDIKDDTFFANIVVDTDCTNSWAYIPDLGGYGVVVYDMQADDSWRIQHHFFHFDPLAGNYNIDGVNFQWTDGVFSLALSPKQADGNRKVYFHALSSTKEFEVSTEVLRNKDKAKEYDQYKLLGDRGSDSQSSASFVDQRSGVLFYTQVNKDGVACWNTKKEFKIENLDLVTSDNQTMIFPNDLKVDQDSNLWLLTDRLPKFVYQNLDTTKVNYRVFKAPVADVVKGTKCE